MKRLLSETASTKRATVVAGKRSAPVAYLTDVKCMPIDPVSVGEVREEMIRQGVDAPIALFQTVVEDSHDIQQGDIFTCGGIDYAVRTAERWGEETAYLGSAFKRLVLEKDKP